MKIDAIVKPFKTSRGRITGYLASFHGVSSVHGFEPHTKEQAIADLARKVEFRCQYESTNVEVISIHGHVGVFSYDLDGSVSTRHLTADSDRPCVEMGSKQSCTINISTYH